MYFNCVFSNLNCMKIRILFFLLSCCNVLISQVLVGDCTVGGVKITGGFSNKSSAENGLSSSKQVFNTVISNNYVGTYHLLNSGSSGSIGIVHSYTLNKGTKNELLTQVKLFEVGNCNGKAILPSNNMYETPEFYNLKVNTNYIAYIYTKVNVNVEVSEISTTYYQISSSCTAKIGEFTMNGAIGTEFNQYKVATDSIVSVKAFNYSLPIPATNNTSTFGYFVFTQKPTDNFYTGDVATETGFKGICVGEKYVDTNKIGASKITSSNKVWLYPATFDKRTGGVNLDDNNDNCYAIGVPIILIFSEDPVQVPDVTPESCGKCSISSCPIIGEFVTNSINGSQRLTEEFNLATSEMYFQPTYLVQGPANLVNFYEIDLKSVNQTIGVKQAVNFFKQPSTFTRKAILRSTCTSVEIPVSRLNANNLTSGFNPEWDNLPKGKYYLEIQTSFPKDGTFDYSVAGYYSIPDSLRTVLAKSLVINSPLNSITDTMTVLQMSATVTPVEAKQLVSWSVSPTALARIGSDGRLIPISNGTVTVTANTQDGTNISSTKVITINNANVLTKKVSIVKLDDDSTIIANKGIVHFGTSFLPLNTSNKSGVWSVSPSNFAAISQSGELTPFNPGKVTITFTTNDGSGISGSMTYEIVQKIQSITIETPINTPNITDTMTSLQLIANILPVNASSKNVTWSVSPYDLANINQSGLLIPKKNGSVTVTAIANDGSKVQATRKVLIDNKNVKISNIDINYIHDDSLIASQGGLIQFNAWILPLNASNKELVWSVKPDSLASISATGLMTPKGKGTIIVTATAKDGSNITKSLTINVNPTKVFVKSIALSTSFKDTIFTGLGNSLQVSATIVPSVLSNTKLKWEVTPNATAQIDQNGLLTFLKEGNITVKTTAIDSGAISTSYSWYVSFKKKKILVSAINIGYEKNDSVIKVNGGLIQFSSSVLPVNATTKSVFWDVTPSDIATIDRSGLLRVFKKGTVVVTAYALDEGNVSNSVTLDVNPVFLDINYNKIVTLSGDSIIKAIGDTLNLALVNYPTSSTIDPITWSVFPKGIITIDTNYLFVTALNQGIATITAQSRLNPLRIAIHQIIVDTNFIPVTSIKIQSLNGDTIISTAGGTLQLHAVFNPSNTNDTSLVWSVFPSELATISQSGLLTALGNGVVTVTVKTKRGKLRVVYSFRITLTNQSKAQLVEMEKNNIVIYPNPTYGKLQIQHVSQNSKVEVIDLYGKHIRTFYLTKGNNELDLGDLDGGMYFLKIVNDTNTEYQFKIHYLSN